MSSDTIALLGMALGLMATAIGTSWRMSALATSFRERADALQRTDQELRDRIAAVDRMPAMEQRIGQLEKLVEPMPKAIERIGILEEKAKQSKEWRKYVLPQGRGSRPDTDDEE